MGKKKSTYPKNHEEQLEICYGTDYVRKKRYFTTIQNDVISLKREKEVIDSIDPSVDVKKVDELDEFKKFKDRKRPDLIIESESLFIEVTSLNTPISTTETFDPSIEVLRKINTAITHVEEKNKLDREDYQIGGVIFIDIQLRTFKKVLNEELLIEYIKDSIFRNSAVSFLLFRVDSGIEQKIKWDGGKRTKQVSDSHTFHPPIIFVKNDEKMMNKVSRIFTRYPQPESIVIHSYPNQS